MKIEMTLMADHHQFYLQDEGSPGDLSDAWTEESTRRMLATAPGTIGVGTVRQMPVSVVIEVAAQEPLDTFENWDQVVDASIEVPTGKVVVAGCTDYFPEARRVQIEPGSYRVRTFYGGLNTLTNDGLDGDDHYRVVLWPGERIEPIVKKAWAHASTRFG